MNPNLNVARGHSNQHERSTASTSVRLAAAKTSNLERVHLMPEVVRIMSSNDVTDRMTLWLEPRLLFRADRALEPSILGHWETLANPGPRLVVRSSADAKVFDTILFNVEKLDDRTDQVVAWIRDWRTFTSGLGHDEMDDASDVSIYDHMPPEATAFPCIVDHTGNIRNRPDGMAPRGEMTPDRDHISGVLNWFGNLIADPTAFEFTDLGEDDELWD